MNTYQKLTAAVKADVRITNDDFADILKTHMDAQDEKNQRIMIENSGPDFLEATRTFARQIDRFSRYVCMMQKIKMANEDNSYTSCEIWVLAGKFYIVDVEGEESTFVPSGDPVEL